MAGRFLAAVFCLCLPALAEPAQGQGATSKAVASEALAADVPDPAPSRPEAAATPPDVPPAAVVTAPSSSPPPSTPATDVSAGAGPPGANVENIIGPEHHPWGRFEPGAWKLVRTVTETLDAEGNVSSKSTSETRTVLRSKNDTAVTLEVRTTLEVAGKRFEGEPQTVVQSYSGEPQDVESRATELPPGQLTIDGRKIDCRVQRWESASPVGDGKSTTTLYFSPSVSPYLLKRETQTTEADGVTPLSEQNVEVVSLGLPWSAVAEMRSAALVHSVNKHVKGCVITWALYAADIPGGVICHTSKELDKAGQITRRSTLELLGYGATREDDRPSLQSRPKRRTRMRELPARPLPDNERSEAPTDNAVNPPTDAS